MSQGRFPEAPSASPKGRLWPSSPPRPTVLLRAGLCLPSQTGAPDPHFGVIPKGRTAPPLSDWALHLARQTSQPWPHPATHLPLTAPPPGFLVSCLSVTSPQSPVLSLPPLGSLPGLHSPPSALPMLLDIVSRRLWAETATHHVFLPTDGPQRAGVIALVSFTPTASLCLAYHWAVFKCWLASWMNGWMDG